mmetsp:Transcript_16910/g.33860  ORF Transcript_16910/g.33860 Transcript_16910/m.33860 type:complete len:261 (+) Transcript_16910:2-784(+)
MLNRAMGLRGSQARGRQNGAALLGASWGALIVLFVTYLALRPSGGERSELLEEDQRFYALASKPATRTNVPAGLQKVRDSLKRKSPSNKHPQQVLADSCECPKCNPLAEIDEPNVFPGPSDYGPDSPSSLAPGDYSSNGDSCCGAGGAWGADPISCEEMHKVYEITEPNFREWKEYEPPRNVFPGIIDWDPDSPNQAGSARETKELFDGHGGIIGLEDSDGWERTPGSVAPDTYGDYAHGADGMDYNVLAHGYKFPEYRR